MTKTHREFIPFFSELPDAAIRAAAILFDACRAPEYNGVQAYNDFVQNLSDRGIDAPTRSIVKRYVAGVQGGFFDRPGGPHPASMEDSQDVSASAGVPAYFAKLPPTAIAALQSVWDRASVEGFDLSFLYNGFCRDLVAIGHAEPNRTDFNLWVSGVKRGEIERPAKIVGSHNNAHAAEQASVKMEFPSGIALTEGEAGDVDFQPLTTENFRQHLPAPMLVTPLPISPDHLREMQQRMVDQLTEEYMRDARARATKAVAQQLRDLADELESAA